MSAWLVGLALVPRALVAGASFFVLLPNINASFEASGGPYHERNDRILAAAEDGSLHAGVSPSDARARSMKPTRLLRAAATTGNDWMVRVYEDGNRTLCAYMEPTTGNVVALRLITWDIGGTDRWDWCDVERSEAYVHARQPWSGPARSVGTDSGL